MNETAKHVIGKETPLECPCEIPPNETIREIVHILCRNQQDNEFLRMVLMRARNLEHIKLGD